MGLAPPATPRRVISAMPRVINAALALSPKPRPSQMPDPMAMMFLSAPPNSTPAMSSLVYTLKRGEVTRAWALAADRGF